jgi:HAD superfamily hydrolase (TIGR01549 family)
MDGDNMFKAETILFDLDGTLLPIDMDHFLKLYFKALTEEFSDLEQADQLIDALMQATQHMVENDGERTNQEVFIDSFFSMIEVDDIEQTMQRFDDFYDQRYPLLKNKLSLDTQSRKLINLLGDSGYEMVIATNPLFPYKAIIERIKWAGLDPEQFSYITCYEEMHYSKPNVEFYREIVDELELNPTECIMIGNNVQEDMIAGKLGMTTYLVDDYIIDHNDDDINPNWRGSLAQLISHAKENISV